jgi:hypothetical protein
MSRPEKITEASRQKRLTSRKRQGPDFGEPACKSPLLPFENEPGDHKHRLQTDLRIDPGLDLTRDFSTLLVWLENESRFMRHMRANRPTPDRMARTVEGGAKHVRKLWEWSQDLPAALFSEAPVFIPGTPPLRAVIQHLADTFDRMSEIYPKRGRGKPSGTRDDAQWLAMPLMIFTYSHAPKATDTQRREFVRNCLVDLLGINCPNPSHHPGDFVKWFRPVEARAKRAHAERHDRLRLK